MAKANKYKDKIKSGKIGILGEIVDINNFEIADVSETDRVRIYLRFILETVNLSDIRVSSLIHEFCLLEKALGGEYGGRFIVRNRDKCRYVPIASYDHYRVIVFHGLKKLGMNRGEDEMLGRDEVRELAGVIWH